MALGLGPDVRLTGNVRRICAAENSSGAPPVPILYMFNVLSVRRQQRCLQITIQILRVLCSPPHPAVAMFAEVRALVRQTDDLICGENACYNLEKGFGYHKKETDECPLVLNSPSPTPTRAN